MKRRIGALIFVSAVLVGCDPPCAGPDQPVDSGGQTTCQTS